MTTQTLESQWGRDPLTVGADIPTVATRFHLGRVHVGTPPLEVARETWAAIKIAPVTYDRRQRRETIAAALWLHAENYAEYVAVMSGRF